MYFTFAKVTIQGKYVADGRLLILPIQGDGDAEIVLFNTKVSIKAKPKVLKEGSRLILEVDKVKVFLEPQR